MAKKPRRLVRLRISEVSLVDEGANHKKFSIVKAKDGGSEMDPKLKELIEKMAGIELSDEAAERFAKALSDEDREAVLKHLTLLEKYKGDFPEDAVAAIGQLAGFIGGVKPEAVAKKDDGTTGDEGDADLDDVLEKAGKRFSKAVEGTLQKVIDAVDALKDIMTEHVEKADKQHASAGTGAEGEGDGDEDVTAEDIAKMVNDAVDGQLTKLGVKTDKE